MILTKHSQEIFRQQLENVLRQTDGTEEDLHLIIAGLPELLKQRMEIMHQFLPPIHQRLSKLRLEAEICRIVDRIEEEKKFRIIDQIEEKEKYQLIYHAERYPTAKLEKFAEELHFNRRDTIAFAYVINYLRELLIAHLNDCIFRHGADCDSLLSSYVLKVDSLILGARISDNTIYIYARQKSTSS